MHPHENLLRVYRELADWYERQRQPQMRDRFLVLAADAAQTAGRADEAERLRLRLLKVNPHHMLKPYASFAEALKAPDVLTYVKDLRVNYPADVAEDLLRTLHGEERRPAAGIPGTAPVLDIDGTLAPEAARPVVEEETAPFANMRDLDADLANTAAPAPLNAPRGRPEPPQTIPLQGQPPPRLAPTRPIPAAPRPLPPPPRRPAALPPDARHMAAPPPEEPVAGGAWFSIVLSVLVLLSGLVLAGFVFARPYLPLP
ncbi:MAG TPA: hypothetical protein VMS17_18970 [Gemmataceae bacterium]|nr:hypothetical protein [Gemmataceae bacterium]